MAETISLVAVGDVLLGPKIERSDGSLIRDFRREQPEVVFEKVGARIRSADIKFCNLEGAFSNRGKMAVGRASAWKSSPEMMRGVVAGGFDIINLANNHIMDYGPGAKVSLCGNDCRGTEDKLMERIATEAWGFPKVGFEPKK